jgi:tRNA (guanine-N7-)-methyltransferase
VLDAEPGFVGGRTDRWEDRPITRFERKGLAVGRVIVDLAYRSTAER